MRIYEKFLDGVPEYLARHYWWAYLWRWGIWFFDHQFIINVILFGQYDCLLQKTLGQIERKPDARILQLTCVYGKLTPLLLSSTGGEVHLCDVSDGQLELVRRKTRFAAERCYLSRMNGECLGYRNDSFDQVMVFFLFHEMPAEARSNTYAEIARVVRPGGSVLVTEYAATPYHHILYKVLPFRCLLGRLEPFLPGFWQEDMAAELNNALRQNGKPLAGQPATEYCFAKFYRVMRFEVRGRDLVGGQPVS